MATKQKTETLDDVTKGDGDKPKEEAKKEATPKRKPPELPTAKSMSAGPLEHKMVVIYGPPGIGKSTLASQWAGGDGFFFNTAGELGELEVYQKSVPNWESFREHSWALAENPEQFPCCVIDTSDTLGRYCAEVVRKALGIVHESDLDWGKGWSTLRDTWQINIAKLAAIPDLGVVHVAHSTEAEVKTRSATWNKNIIRGVKGVREALVDMADIVLFVDYAEGEDEQRVIKTKPSRYWDAKERGQSPRLPAEIVWPLGENGWDLINGLWTKGAK